MKITNEQMEFARGMSPRQWRVLDALQVPYYLSASERADQEIWSLVRNKLASIYSGVPGMNAIYMWRRTEAGEELCRRRASGKL